MYGNLIRIYQSNHKAKILPAIENTLPKRLLTEPMPSGPTKGQVHRLDELLPEYYNLRGWDSLGVPTPEKLKDLGL